MDTQKFIVSIIETCASGPISEMEFPNEGVKARVLGPGAVVEVEFLPGGLRHHQFTTLNQIREQIKALWPVKGEQGWRPVGYHEYDNFGITSSMTVLEMDYQV